ADSLFDAHVRPQARVDEWLFDGAIPTVWLQRHLWHGAAHLRWWDYASWGVYLTHFFATLVVAAVLWLWWTDRLPHYTAIAAALAAALVYTSEHYVSDCLLGWVYAFTAFAAVNRVADRRGAPAYAPAIAD